MHGFAKARYNSSGAMIEAAEDHADRLGAAIAPALDRKFLDLETGQRVKVLWTGGQTMQDGDEADAYHSVQNFEFRALA